MKKFIRYLYEYRNGKCVQNVGFVKVEESKESGILQIYGKEFLTAGGTELELLLFYQTEGKCIGISHGNTRGIRPMTAYRVEYDRRNHDIAGIILRRQDTEAVKYYAAIWDEQKINVENVIPQDTFVKQEVIEEKKSTPEETSKELVYKITRKDIVNLPRQEWKLANNHFLVHGCRNFHHLVSFEKDGTCWLGVPGIYHKQEEEADNAFGFGRFMKPDEGEIEWEDEEKAEHEEFGYWCRPVPHVIKR